jgi:hypothetical protein
MDMNAALQTRNADNLRREYGGRSAAIDALIARYDFIETDALLWREKIEVDGLVFPLNNGALQAHPLVDRILRSEYYMSTILRQIYMLFATLPKEDQMDEFDRFLERMAQQSRPHETRHHGGS